MADIKEEFEEFATCLCVIIVAACSFDCCFIIVMISLLMIDVMTISFELPHHIFKSLLVAKNGKFVKIQFQKLRIAIKATITI